MARRERVWRQWDLHITAGSVLCLILALCLLQPRTIAIDITTSMPVYDTVKHDQCCHGTLGYATSDPDYTMVCSEMKCCNHSETVAVIPVDIALGFQFRCMSRQEVRPLCYQAGIEVRTSNQDPDHTPRVCCEGAKFDILLNQWYAAMIVKCVAR